MHALNMVLRGAAGPSRRRHVGRRHPRDALFRRAARRSRKRRASPTATGSSSARATRAARSTRRLAEAGFIPVEALSTYMKPLSLLNGHPNRNYVPGVEANTGPLGHGMPIAVGIAIAGKLDRARLPGLRHHRRRRIAGGQQLGGGDGGRAPQARQSDPDRRPQHACSRARASPRPTTLEPLADKFRAFGWDVVDVDGHDPAALLDAFDAARRRASSRSA